MALRLPALRRTPLSGFTSKGVPAWSGGGVKINVSTLGAKEAVAKLRRVEQTVYRDLGVVAYHAADGIRARAQKLVPYVTGALHDGIQIEKQGPYHWTVTASSQDGGADAEYAGFVEYGTSKMTARPYLRPAASEQRQRTQAELAMVAARLVRM